jgi:hypothetical protein
MTKTEKTKTIKVAKEMLERLEIKAPMTKITLLESGTNNGEIDYVMFEYAGMQYQAYIDANGGSINEYAPVEEPRSELVKVQLLAFSGMVIGEFEATHIEGADGFELTLKDGRLVAFDGETMKQINAEKPQFANRIRILK